MKRLLCRSWPAGWCGSSHLTSHTSAASSPRLLRTERATATRPFPWAERLFAEIWPACLVLARQTRLVGHGVSYDGRIAGAYDAGRILLPEAETALLESVDGLVEAGSMLVDVGAGTGRFAGLFARRFGCRVIAVEPATTMRSQGVERGESDVVWLSGRAESLPIRQSAADVVWLACVIHYLDLVAAGHELARVLRPGGQVLVRSMFPDRFDDLEWIRWFPAARAIDEQRMPTVDALESVWAECGLYLADRRLTHHLAARDLADLAERLGHRAISTLELISDDEFEAGMTALREDARSTPKRPVYSPVDVLSFRLS
jgi:SAM-dependent methyltransferase